MPPPRCHLSINAPSPTTIEYKVSTASPPKNLRSYCLQYSTIFLRVFLGFSIICATLEKLSVAPLVYGFGHEYVQGIPWSRFSLLIAVIGFLIARRWHCEESLLVLRTLGIQTTTLSSSYLLPATTRFIPTAQVRDVFIHEAFRGFEVRFYLCVVMEGEGEAVVVFPKILPNREILEQVWRGARQCLYEPKE